MAIGAYVLINAAGSKVPEILEEIKSISEVKSVAAVMGPYDIIARVEAEDTDSIGVLIMERIHKLEGVTRTLSCVVLKS